jgi:hypothetical protein
MHTQSCLIRWLICKYELKKLVPGREDTKSFDLHHADLKIKNRTTSCIILAAGIYITKTKTSASTIGSSIARDLTSHQCIHTCLFLACKTLYRYVQSHTIMYSVYTGMYWFIHYRYVPVHKGMYRNKPVHTKKANVQSA